MPRTAKLQNTLDRLKTNPVLAGKVDWDKLIADNPDLNIDAIRRDFGQYLPEAPADADVNYILAHPLHKPRQLTFGRYVGDKLSKAWDSYTGKLAEFGDLNIPLGFPIPESQRIAGNIGLGAIKAAAGFPAMLKDIGHVAAPIITGGIQNPLAVTESARRGQTMLEEFVSPAAKAAALVTSRLESSERPPTDTERQMYEDVTGKEAFGVVAPVLTVIGGPKMVKAGYKYLRGAGRRILSSNFQKLAGLEGVEGDFVRVGDRPGYRKVYHKHPTEGWREYSTGKKAGGELADALDQYNQSVIPADSRAMKLDVPMTPLLPGFPKRTELPAPEVTYGEGFTTKPGKSKSAFIMEKDGKRFVAEPYIRKSARQMRPEEKVVADLADEIVSEKAKPVGVEAISKPAIEPPAIAGSGEILQTKGEPGMPKLSQAERIEGEVQRLSSVKIKIDEAFNSGDPGFVSDIMKDPEAGAIRFPSKAEVKEAAFRFSGPKRPSTILMKSDSGQRMIPPTITAETVGRTIRAHAELIMDNAIKRKYPSGMLNKADRKWMIDNFKQYYEKGQSMPNDRIQGFADGWMEASNRLGQLAEKIGVKIRVPRYRIKQKVEIVNSLGRKQIVEKWVDAKKDTPGVQKFYTNYDKSFGLKQNYFPHVLTEKGRLALEAIKVDKATGEMIGGGKYSNALIVELKRQGKTAEGIKQFIEDIKPENEAEAVKRHGSLENPRILDMPDKIIVDGKEIKLLETDPFEVIPNYINRSSRRMGVIKSFGQGNDYVKSLLESAGEDTRAKKAIREAWEDVQGKTYRPNIEINPLMGVVRPIENITRAAVLSLSQLANVPGEIAITYKAGLKNSAKAFINSFRPSQKITFEADRKLGAWSADVLRDLQTTEDLTGKTGRVARKAMRAYGFEGINRHINKVASRAMQLTIEDYFELLRKGESSAFERVTGRSQVAITRTLQRDFFWTAEDISRIKASGLSTADKARVAQRAPALVNVMGESSLDRPSWMRHPVIQRMAAYTSFARAMGNIMSDATKEAGHGNFFPLAKFLAGQQLAGELEIWLKNYVLNRERTDKDWLDRLTNNFLGSMTFGLWGVGYEKYQYMRGNPIETMVPPNIEIPIELSQDIIKAVEKGELPEAMRAVAERIPIWKAAAIQTEKMVSPETAAERKRQRTERLMRPDFNDQIAEAIHEDKMDEVEEILAEAEKRGVQMNLQSIKDKYISKYGETKDIDKFEMLGAGRLKK